MVDRGFEIMQMFHFGPRRLDQAKLLTERRISGQEWRSRIRQRGEESSVAAVRLTANRFRKTGYAMCHGLNNHA